MVLPGTYIIHLSRLYNQGRVGIWEGISQEDILEWVRKHLPEILENDTRVQRIVPGWPDDAKMKPYWG